MTFFKWLFFLKSPLNFEIYTNSRKLNSVACRNNLSHINECHFFKKSFQKMFIEDFYFFQIHISQYLLWWLYSFWTASRGRIQDSNVSGEGGGVRTPCTLPLDPPLARLREISTEGIKKDYSFLLAGCPHRTSHTPVSCYNYK